jgi:hypothetical protein
MNILMKNCVNNLKGDEKLFSNSFEFLKHKHFSMFVMNKLEEENIKFRFSSFQYPNLTILKLNEKM